MTYFACMNSTKILKLLGVCIICLGIIAVIVLAIEYLTN